ncbi:hypothetical protein BOG92_000085 [Streptomyces sp. WAC00263]|nr:hypothetical protein BOG92_054440 [Streptomyces sp. WAC00263]KAF5990621.1 hypothetical protein BOG92_000085 [Streptomyces sp. WAC00263]
MVRAAGELGGELRRLMERHSGAAVQAVELLVVTLHSGAPAATVPAREARVDFAEIGRALALVEDAGLLIHRAAALLLGIPAANQAVDQVLWESGVQEARHAAVGTPV